MERMADIAGLEEYLILTKKTNKFNFSSVLSVGMKKKCFFISLILDNYMEN